MNTNSLLRQHPKFAFPFKVHSLLEDAVHEGNECIVSWLPHGRAFKIYSKRQFEANILPRYYTTTKAPKYRSFSRQLAIYGFKMNTDRTSPDRGSYSHPLMVRGKPELCLGMFRQKIKVPTTATERSSSSCGAAAGGNNNNKKKRQPLVNNLAPAVPAVSEYIRCQGRRPAAPNSSACQQCVLNEVVADISEPSMLLRLGRFAGDDSSRIEEDLLSFAIVANEYIARTMKSPSSSPMDRGENSLVGALIMDAASSSPDSEESVVDDDDDWVLGGRTATHNGSHPVTDATESLQQQEAGIFNDIEQLVIRPQAITMTTSLSFNTRAGNGDGIHASCIGYQMGNIILVHDHK